MEKKKVAIGLSGGVDSSVAAHLLKKQGYEVVGVYMQCWDTKADGCTAEADRSYAVASASHLDIKFEHLDFIDQYKSKVIDYFYTEYQNGRTPNPDVLCNKEIKFGLFYEWALKSGFDYVATGHYARVSEENGKFSLLKGVDSTKDQSYFLYLLDSEHLARTLFPVGGYTKKEIRKIAKEAGLPTMDRPESMGICFIGEVDIKDFLKKRVPEKAGNVLSVGGEIIGTHSGAWFYTIGQRHGFQVNRYFGNPLYVVSKDVTENTLVVGEQKDVFSSKFDVENVHWIVSNPLSGDSAMPCDVRIRHLGEIHSCKIQKNDSGVSVVLDNPVFAVAPGQSAVFYQDDVVLGGGVIK
ncbi:tRNA 2-thiouridine(34) synthase MnmA [candidate division WWE3 bacterium RIFOXYD1_FULL_39_9]|uniref:tRNA-specific 2-thiouridylase MnmA n=1 Tax=candidate division WWE3 bacterium RIFOXYD1_FULL_39_9 TaxID=1802649 RepID=A0A1F4X8Z0_UNCKA|nr:MAG: tRNA 2-thiouridine(34) synthase MnmA [candidate division WWE3 bacterium RIFOXYD1_FULL_39_9]